MRGLPYLLMVWVLVPTLAGAQRRAGEAERLLKEGEALGRKGEYEAARERFRRAEELAPKPVHDCWIALTYAREKRWGDAWFYIDRCRARAAVPDPVPWYADAVKQIRRGLERGDFGPVELESVPVGAQVTIDGFLDGHSFVAPRVVWLPYGTHRVTFSAPRHQPRVREIEVESRDRVAVEALLDPEPDPSPEREPVDDAKPDLPENGTIPPPDARPVELPAVSTAAEPDVGARGARTWGWVSLGVGGASLVVGGVFYGMALSRLDDVKGIVADCNPAMPGTCDVAGYDDGVKQMELYNGLALGSLALGAVTTGLGLYLVLSGDGAPEAGGSTVSGVTPAAGGGTIWVRGSF